MSFEHYSTWIVLFGAITVAVGVFLSSAEKTKTQKELQKKTEEIAQLNKEIVNYISGGDTYPYITPSFDGKNRGQVALCLMSTGKNPLYDVSIKMIDHYLMAKTLLPILHKDSGLNITKADIDKGYRYFTIGTFLIGRATEIYSFMFPKELSERTFTFDISARNGYFTETIRIYRSNDFFKSEFEVKKEGKVIFKTPS